MNWLYCGVLLSKLGITFVWAVKILFSPPRHAVPSFDSNTLQYSTVQYSTVSLLPVWRRWRFHFLCVTQCVCVCVCPDEVDSHYRSFSHNRAIEAAMCVLREANSFVQTHQPWLLVKSSSDRADDAAALNCVLHVALESARVAALALSPVTPALSRRILERLGSAPTERTRQHMTQSLPGGRKLGADCGPLFTRIRLSLRSSSVAGQRSAPVWRCY